MGSSASRGRVPRHPPFLEDCGLGDDSIVGMWYWDVPNDRLYADARMAALFSVDPVEAMCGAGVDAYIQGIHPDDRADVAREVERCVRLGIDFRCEYRIVSTAGERLLAAFARCHHAEDGNTTHYVGVAFDITELRDAAAVTPTSRVADHIMQAYSIASQGGDEELTRKLKDVLLRIGMNLAAEARGRRICRKPPRSSSRRRLSAPAARR